MGGKFLESFKVCPAFPEKWFYILDQIWHYELLNQYSMAHKIRFRPLTDLEINL